MLSRLARAGPQVVGLLARTPAKLPSLPRASTLVRGKIKIKTYR